MNDLCFQLCTHKCKDRCWRTGKPIGANPGLDMSRAVRIGLDPERIKQLGPREQAYLLYRIDGVSQEEIARNDNLSPERVRQILVRAVDTYLNGELSDLPTNIRTKMVISGFDTPKKIAVALMVGRLRPGTKSYGVESHKRTIEFIRSWLSNRQAGLSPTVAQSTRD